MLFHEKVMISFIYSNLLCNINSSNPDFYFQCRYNLTQGQLLLFRSAVPLDSSHVSVFYMSLQFVKYEACIKELNVQASICEDNNIKTHNYHYNVKYYYLIYVPIYYFTLNSLFLSYSMSSSISQLSESSLSS